jgi:hypothetical protein
VPGAAVRQYGRFLEFVPEKLKTPDICLAAVRQEVGALQFVPEELGLKSRYLKAFPNAYSNGISVIGLCPLIVNVSPLAISKNPIFRHFCLFTYTH